MSSSSASVPTDPIENARWRQFVLTRGAGNPHLQRQLIEHCKADPVFYVNTFVWQFNPKKRNGPTVAPFVLWDFQVDALREILRAVKEGADLVIEKSREMGASWLCLIAFEWLWHFYPNQKFLCISRNADMVDDRAEPDSLFWKLDFIHSHTPDWLMPRGWVPARHRKQMRFLNPENGSVITGQASTGKAGVGGRATAMFVDEFSQIAEDFEVLHRTSDTTNCRIFNGTHTSLDTAFYQLCNPENASYSFVRRLRMHWTSHPDKVAGLYEWNPESQKVEVLDKSFQYPEGFDFARDQGPTGGPHPFVRSPWYDTECKRKGSSRAVAMDLDIDARGSSKQFFDAFRIATLKRECVPPYWEGEIEFDPDTGEPKGLTEAAGGRLRLWLRPDPRGRFQPMKYGAGADLSYGTGATPTCMTVVSGIGEKVAEWTCARTDPSDFAPIAIAICRTFVDATGQGAYFAWEMPGPGIKFCERVLELGYANVFYNENKTSILRKQSDKPGWYASVKSKFPLLSDYRTALGSRMFVNRSERALDECLAFAYTRTGVEHTGSLSEEDPSGAREGHGDHVIADALAWMCVRDWVTKPAPTAATGGPDPRSLAFRRQLRQDRDREESAWGF